MIAAYEALRQDALGGREGRASGWGRALLGSRGLRTWMEAVGGCRPLMGREPAANRIVADDSAVGVGGDLLPTALRREIVGLVAGMVLGMDGR